MASKAIKQKNPKNPKNPKTVLIGKKNYTLKALQNFSLLHYYYINQLLGD